jgi:transcriptional pleiotropic regulator of transition state genes
MKSTGIIRRIDHLGRLVLPKELRDSFGIESDTPLEIFTEGDTILLKKYQPAGACAFCGELKDTIEFHGLYVCPACRRSLAKLKG